ncbi:MAG TPA: hypothetical protein DER05_08940 [Lutibacter sp.]|nr:hypothetical protein [Lutibacter sp.]
MGCGELKFEISFTANSAKISAKYANGLEILCETSFFSVNLFEIIGTQSYTKKIHKDAQSFKVERKFKIQNSTFFNIVIRKSKIVN